MSNRERLYGFGVVPSARRAPPGVFTVACGAVAVLARKVPPDEFTESNLESPEWLASRIALHHAVLGKAMEGGGVVPWRFGALFSSEDRLRDAVSECEGEFLRHLDRLAGKEEWSVVGRRTDEGSPRASIAPDRAAGEGIAYLLARERERREEEASETFLRDLSEKVFEELGGLGETVASPGPEPDPSIFFRAAVLIRRSDRDRLAALREGWDARGIDWRLSGPHPPYSFVGDAE